LHPSQASAWRSASLSGNAMTSAPVIAIGNRIHLTEPIGTGVANGRCGASGRVPAAEAERPLSVQSRDIREDAG
jgi:hypothetical protein